MYLKEEGSAMRRLSIALSQEIAGLLKEYMTHPVVDVDIVDFTLVSAIVVGDAHVKDMVRHEAVRHFGIPLFVISKDPDAIYKAGDFIVGMTMQPLARLDSLYFAEALETAARRYHL